MDEIALVGKIKGHHPSPEGLKEWARINWENLLHYEPETNALTKGWFGFKFKCAAHVDRILLKHWSFGCIPMLLKEFTLLFDAYCGKMDTQPV